MADSADPVTDEPSAQGSIAETTVTVVVPFCEAYTPRSMLDAAIESIDQQAVVDTEIIVIEDEDQRGPAWARNTGLDRAETRYVAFLDADDTWYETKLRDQLQALWATGAGMCVDGTTDYDSLEFVEALLTGETFGLTSTLIVDTEQTTARFDESLERREDHLYMIEIAAEAGVCFLPGTFTNGTHEDGFSKHVDSSPEQIEEFFLKVVDRVPEAARFRRPYYQNAYVNLGRNRHFDGEYRRALEYFVESLRYGPNVDAVGAIGLTILAVLRTYTDQLGRRLLSSGGPR